MQAQKPVREDDLVASHKVTSVKINHACNDTILITIPVVHFGHISTLIGTVQYLGCNNGKCGAGRSGCVAVHVESM